MAQSSTRFQCTVCGVHYLKWLERCGECRSWSTVRPVATADQARTTPAAAVQLLSEVPRLEPEDRLSSGFAELNHVLGGGFVPGSVSLLAGQPGVGKSTLALQVLVRMGQAGHRGLYVTSEETAPQIRTQADRLDLSTEGITVLAATELPAILSALERPGETARVVVIDSIQTLRDPKVNAPAGTLSQVQACLFQLVAHAKSSAAVMLFIVQLMTKMRERVNLWHLINRVDMLLYLDGKFYYRQRAVRAVKNRLNAALETGFLEMTDTGLRDVSCPAGVFLQDRL